MQDLSVELAENFSPLIYETIRPPVIAPVKIMFAGSTPPCAQPEKPPSSLRRGEPMCSPWAEIVKSTLQIVVVPSLTNPKYAGRCASSGPYKVFRER